MNSDEAVDGSLAIRSPTAIPCEAVLFDLDGVLVDSVAHIATLTRRWAHQYGLNPDTVEEYARSRTDRDMVQQVAPTLDPDAAVATIQQHEVEAAAEVRAMPGAAPMLQSAAARLPWAVVTSGARAVAEARIVAAGLPSPPLLITADDVVSGKPHPEPYQRAAVRLNVAPDRCVVIEDTADGATSGQAAGATVLGLAGAADTSDLACAAHLIIDGLHAVDCKDDRIEVSL